jgi:anti-sigma factor RsiW
MNDKRMNGQDMSKPVLSDDELHEELSAFMDGELDAERARFLQQRLSHDVALRSRWERWQLMSSSMRRQAQPLPAGFADRVSRAVDAETPAHALTHSRSWRGGLALAASLVVAAVFVFDATHQSAPVTPRLAATTAAVLPIQRTVLPLQEPVVKLPIPVESGVVTADRSPLRPVVLREPEHHPSFAPFPQPYAIDPELEAYLQRQKAGASHDVFAEDAANNSSRGGGAVRTVVFPQDGQR